MWKAKREETSKNKEANISPSPIRPPPKKNNF